MTERHLRNAPIVEAVFDVRVEFSKPPNLTALESMHEVLRVNFPVKEVNTLFQASFGIEGGQPMAGATGAQNGFSFKSSDARRIIQARLDGYTFNRLSPYDNWPSFRDEAKEHWNQFVSATSPTRVSRIALRFINRFEVPVPRRELGTYLTITPLVPDNRKELLRTFFLRIEADTSVDQRKSIITSTIDPTHESASRTTIILDVDAFQLVDFTPGDKAMWAIFEDLRNLKNEMFFGSITDQALALFN